MTEKYDRSSVESIFKYAELLTGKTLNETVTLPGAETNSGGRGDLGKQVEAHFFELPPTSSGIDFPAAGLELKTTGLKRSMNGTFQAKERLVLTMINYMNIVDEEWSNSTFMNKCRLMLILFYLYEKGIPSADLKFILGPFLYRIEDHDYSTIRADWEIIRAKVAAGKAHELSEGDTFYLAACRKGSGGPSEKLRMQPNSPIPAKARAFSFKPPYVNSLIGSHVSRARVFDTAVLPLAEATALRFKPFVGRRVNEIAADLRYFKRGPNHKGYLRELSARMLGSTTTRIPELEKAGIEIKTIRLNKSGKPREAMSFPGFKFLEILEESWEDSAFHKKLESKFLFVIFREDASGEDCLERVMYWNMPYEDRLEAERVWGETQKRVAVDAFDLPRSTESHVAHVRPKGRDAKDTLPTPQGLNRVKQCFWLNASYISKVIHQEPA